MQPEIVLKPLRNTYKRDVCFVKRKRGLLKKAMELSMLCQKNVMVYIHDPKANLFV